MAGSRYIELFLDSTAADGTGGGGMMGGPGMMGGMGMNMGMYYPMGGGYM